MTITDESGCSAGFDVGPVDDIETLRHELQAIKTEAMFLIQRLDSLEIEMPERGNVWREYCGHVHPSKARLYAMVKDVIS
ncbi:hypothetical protein EV128_12213 [Rhizobium azibense]|nr:hypothetical protein EV128_12213 [Rhizobium azibense]